MEGRMGDGWRSWWLNAVDYAGRGKEPSMCLGIHASAIFDQ